MPIKLQVIRDGADASDPADYLYEQDRITIGRGSNNDLTLPDQKVSKHHAEIRAQSGQYVLVDCDSKNHTYVHGSRVGETKGYVLSSGDVFTVGDFRVEFVPLFMPSSEQTAFADPAEDESNAFESAASHLSKALEGFIETYTYLPSDRRDDELDEALQKHLGADIDQLGEHAVVQYLVERFRVEEEDPAAVERAAPTDEAVDTVLDALLQGTARMISIPTHFWREFSGNTVVHPPDRAFVHQADLNSLRNHLLDASLTEAERSERLARVRDAIDTLIAHNVAMLAAYKTAVAQGTDEILEKLNPARATAQSDEGSFRSFFGNANENESLEQLQNVWDDLDQQKSDRREQKYFRPPYIEAYLHRMADAWGVSKEDIVEVTDAST